MDWKQLLSAKRLGRQKKSNSSIERTPFQVDYDRIVFSSAFRRLQDKTQVFPLAENDYVRTRLTHSMEVSCISRSLGIQIGMVLCDRHKFNKDVIHPSDFGTILATAALAHDLGNPPFGHSGEDAIRHWFETSPVVKAHAKRLTKAQIADIRNYDGNAQGFRLLSRLEMPENQGGMQLTYAVLASLLKYPVESTLIGASPSVRMKKFNFFQTEKDKVLEVAEAVGLERRHPTKYSWCRHPLVYVVEAADDICYRIVDFEDGFRLGIVSYEETRDLFLSIISDTKTENKLSSFKSNKNRVEYLRAKAMQKLVQETVTVFLDMERDLLSGTVDKSLISYIPSSEPLKKLKDRAFEDVYSDKRVIEIEAAGFEVAMGLLDLFFGSAMDHVLYGSKANPQSRKIIQLMPEQFLPTGEENIYEIILRMLDFFSGMTDSYAVSVYKKLKGISLPGQ